MPRRPTRSNNSKRPTRDSIARRLDDVEADDEDDEVMTLAELLADDDVSVAEDDRDTPVDEVEGFEVEFDDE
jgi:hypothetical protein